MARTRRQSRRKQKGGVYVGHGTYGCGFRPALRCKNEAGRRPGKFSKLLSKENAKDEMRFRMMLSPHDRHQQYFLYPETICRPAPYAPEDNIYRCPHDFSDLREARVVVLGKGGRALSKFQPLPSDYPAFFNSLLNLFDGLLRIHAAGIAHNDIKPDNVVTRRRSNGEYHTRFIDFGLTVDGNTLAARAADPDDNMHDYNVLQSNYLYWSFDVRMTDPAVLASAGARSASTHTRLRNYYTTVDVSSGIIPHRAFKNPPMTIIEVSQIAQRLALMPLADRHSFIMTRSDLMGLGLALAETYLRLTGHCDRGEAVPLIKVIDGFYIPGGSVFIPPDHAVHNYNAADRAWHVAVRDNISIPFYALIRRMIAANTFNRISLADARDAYAAILPQMAALFTRANVLSHVKPDALGGLFEEPVDFGAAVAAAGRPASSSPAVVAAAADAEADDVMGFAQSPPEFVSPHEAAAARRSSSSHRGSRSLSSSSNRSSAGSWHEVVRNSRGRRQTRRRKSSL
jgi:serine/threonine protein kinase